MNEIIQSKTVDESVESHWGGEGSQHNALRRMNIYLRVRPKDLATLLKS